MTDQKRRKIDKLASGVIKREPDPSRGFSYFG